MPETEQSKALRLADEYRETMTVEVLHLWAKDARAELRRRLRQLARCRGWLHQHVPAVVDPASVVAAAGAVA